MYRVSVEKSFDAAHYLRGYKGKCEALHGHRFRVLVSVQASALDDIGLAYDFTDLKKHLGDILARFDHTCLNDVPPFDKINPSSEHIAATIYEELKARVSEAQVALESVEVWESPYQGIAYRPD
jgi:6-pyruvoyltetrahydropterin/6-carboxytetrahydropterin synthase